MRTLGKMGMRVRCRVASHTVHVQYKTVERRVIGRLETEVRMW